jgi:hypothetical protein
MQTTTTRRLLLAVLAAAILAPAAFAGGEQKNQSPFTRIVSTGHHDSAPTVVRGEPKDMRPFTNCLRPSTKRAKTTARTAVPWVAAIPAADI